MAGGLRGSIGGDQKTHTPKRYLFVEEPSSLINGLLTQTMKLKRRKILELYRARIDELYAG